MAISEAFAGSENVTATEHDLPSDTTTLGAQTDDGVYQVFLDLNTLVDGDVFRFAAYEKVGSASTQRRFFSQEISNDQGVEENWVSPTFILLHGWTFTLTRISATSRVIDWSIRKVA
jgi:hypothetical protein